jgi:hypothetical protein
LSAEWFEAEIERSFEGRNVTLLELKDATVIVEI